MNNYEKMAKDFCNKYGIKISFKFDGVKLNKLWEETEDRNVWKCVLKKGKKQYTVTFWDSIYNTLQGKKQPSEYDILSCLTKYDPYSYEDFCDAYGYEQNKNSYKIYLATQKEYDNLCRIFSDDEDDEELWEDFREIC